MSVSKPYREILANESDFLDQASGKPTFASISVLDVLPCYDEMDDVNIYKMHKIMRQVRSYNKIYLLSKLNIS